MKNLLSNELGEVISTRNHVLIKQIRALHSRAERDRPGLYYAEGMRFFLAALHANAEIKSVLFSPPLLGDAFGRRTTGKVLRRAERLGISCHAVTPEVLQSVALNDDPQGIGIVMRQRWNSLETINQHTGLCWVVLDTVNSPGNLGTIIRTAEAVGAAGIILLDKKIDLYHPATVRATMGALFNSELRFIRTRATSFMKWKRHNDVTLVGTSPSASRVHYDTPLPYPLAIWMGGERKGLSLQQQNDCDFMVKIPMRQDCDSLNLAVATGIILYEVHRQKHVRLPES